ncbi:MAG: DNA-protecting protein DprA [Candidatus Magasanikbacteria bacterium]|nr:DNA-protecting protein DprA [Candidatus Magasanikbacteria bacterium]
MLTALPYFPKLTYARFKKLWQYFSNPENIWQAEIGELIQAGWDANIAAEFMEWREGVNVEKIKTELEKEKITTVVLGQPGYPRLLSEIADPPFVLFVRGTLPPDEQPAVAIVGTRKCSTYGKQVTEQLATELARAKVVVVSGLALGIDGVAHQAVLAAGGTTIAVLGSGVNQTNIYPASHQHLAEQIIKNDGAIISEYPPGFEPTQYSFPARNRIIAGLTLGTLVTEAPTNSGALITAKCALDYNREVFAVPHPLTSVNGAGGNNLLKMGARLVTSATDILDEFQIHNIEQIITNNKILPSTPNEAKLLPHLSKEPTHIDALTKASGLDSGTVGSTLTMMEMKGKVKNVGGMQYIVK